MRLSNEQLLSVASKSLTGYASLIYPQFELAAHHAKLIEKLEDVEAGRCKRLMVFMPPRHGKSLLSTQIFPSWFIGRNPEKSIITATYSQDLSDDFGRVVRNFANDQVTQATFPALKIAEDSNSMKRFTTSAGGAYYSVGRGASITGRGAHLLLIDDPLKDMDEARSEVIRRSLHTWYSSVAYTRLMGGGAIILIQTRWHHDDLAGWLLREHPEENWEILNLPATAEVDEGWRPEGAPLWPERCSADTLAAIKMAVGGATWAALYQQRPTAAEGEVFKRDWWQRYTDIPKLKRIVQSWDTAFKTGAENDYSVCTTWGEGPDGFYLLHHWKKRVEFPELKRQVGALAAEWKPTIILIEDKASGQSLIQEIKQSTRFAVRPIKVDTDKLSRAYAASPLVECGKVFLPKAAPWLEDYLSVMSTFPAGAHDDDVDSTTQALNFMRGSNMSYGLWGALRVLQSGSREQLDAALGRSPAPAVEAAAPKCDECGSDFIQKMPRGFRCGQCGSQWGSPAEPIPANQQRSSVQNAWRM